MAMSLQEQLRAKRAEAERWIREREAQVRRAAAAAEAKGRQVYKEAIRTGQKVLARTPSEIRALGEAAIRGRLPQAVGEVVVKEVVRRAAPRAGAPGVANGGPAKPGARPATPAAREAGRQLEAAASGFVDEATFGLADHVLAGGGAVVEAIRDRDASGVINDYSEGVAVKRQQDEFDAKHYGAARRTGQVAGFAGSVVALGAPAVTRALVTRVPRGAAIMRDIAKGATRGPDPRGLTKAAAVSGGFAGGVDQVVADVLTGRSSDPHDQLGSTFGGAVGGVATRFAGPTVGGAVGGVTTAMVTDLLHGKAPSFEKALDDGRGAALFGRFGDIAGRQWVANLKPAAKGEVGETFSRFKTVMRGDEILDTQKRVSVGNGRHTVADEWIKSPRADKELIGESKMGPSSRLTDNQKRAQKLYGDRYVLDQWRFSDVGAAVGGGVAPLGANLGDEDRGLLRQSP